MTPVDIDKLKELLASQGWVPWPHRIVPPSVPAQELCIAAVNDLAALIAKAERVDALTEVVERAQQILSKNYQNWHLAATNAPSPKESE